jgi:hypothetical protein
VSTQLTDEVENKEKREMIKRIVNIKCEKKQHLIRVASPPTFPLRGRQDRAGGLLPPIRSGG